MFTTTHTIYGAFGVTHLRYFAAVEAAYGCDTYGGGAYSADCATSGSLANTGQDIVLPIVGSLLLIAVAIYGFIQLRRKK